MVDSDTTVARSFAWLFREPMVFIVFCQQLLEALAEGLQLPLVHQPLGAQELGDEAHGRGDLAYHVGPGVKGRMHGGGVGEGQPAPVVTWEGTAACAHGRGGGHPSGSGGGESERTNSREKERSESKDNSRGEGEKEPIDPSSED